MWNTHSNAFVSFCAMGGTCSSSSSTWANGLK
jgi:hypothetical protein